MHTTSQLHSPQPTSTALQTSVELAERTPSDLQAQQIQQPVSTSPTAEGKEQQTSNGVDDTGIV